MNSKQHWMLVVLYILFAVAIIGVLKGKQLVYSPSNTSTPLLISISPTPTDDPKIWKTYTNSALNFSLSYPGYWKTLTFPSDGVGGSSFYEENTPHQNAFHIVYPIQGPYTTSESLGPAGQIEDYKNYYSHSTSFSNYGGEQVSKSNIRISGKAATKYIIRPIKEPGAMETIWIFIPLKDHIMLLDLTNSEEANKVLSTFKFTN